MGSNFDWRKLWDTEKYLCDVLVDTIKKSNKSDTRLILHVLNISKTSSYIVDGVFKKLSRDDLMFLIAKGLHPKCICSAISKAEFFDQKLLLYVIDLAKTNKMEAKYFSPQAIANIVDTEEGVRDHALETLKTLDEHGVPLDVGYDKEIRWVYHGENMKEIVMLLLKHGNDKDDLLDLACYGSCDTEAIKYLIVERGAHWDNGKGDSTLIEHLTNQKGCSPELLQFLFEELKLSTNAANPDYYPPFDAILENATNLGCIQYMLSINAPMTTDITTLSFEKRMVFAVVGKLKPNKDEETLKFFEAFWIEYLKGIIADICDAKTLGREVFQADQEPVWDPECINFKTVPLNYFLDAVYLFSRGSYHENHPYYQKVLDLYGKKPGFHRNVSKITMDEIMSNLKTISTLLHWSPIERQMLGNEAERDFKRIKTNK